MQMHSVETKAGIAICAAPSIMPVRRSLPLIQISLDVLDGHRGVVDQNADRQRQSAQRHDVDAFAQRAQHADGRQNRQRNGNRDDQGAAPASQKQEDHERRQAGGDDRLADHSIHRGAHKQRLVRHQIDLQRRRKRGGDARKHLPHILNDIQRGSRSGFHDRQQRAALAVPPHDVGLGRKSIAHMRDVPDVNRAGRRGLHRKIVDLLRRSWGWRSARHRTRIARFSTCRWAESGSGCRSPSPHRRATVLWPAEGTGPGRPSSGAASRRRGTERPRRERWRAACGWSSSRCRKVAARRVPRPKAPVAGWERWRRCRPS